MSTSPEFVSLRLKIARLRHFPRAIDAIRVLEERFNLKGRTYRAYERGEKRPRAETAANLERLYKVTPPGWILAGGGESLAELEATFKSLQKKAREKLGGALDDEDEDGQPGGTLLAFPDGKTAGAVNQLTSQFDIDSSQRRPDRRIPVLTADEIAPFLSRAGAPEEMPGRTLPLPPDLAAGLRAFTYELPAHDYSMVGGAINIAPLTLMIIDPDQDILPGNILMARPKGARGWLIRRYQAALPLAIADAFELHAANPSVDPLRITDKTGWDIAGRMIYTLQRW